ncbi:hypothetical protein [Bdellovibrio sp. HCB337]|uniref:hypothetical protein n=1 Tax=Bdellovibrio sp. HCB337 TaxID=3394358 RepID=UPI0039A590E0
MNKIFVLLITTATLFTSATSFAKDSIKATPFKLNFSVKKSEFPVQVNVTGKLTCWIEKCTLGFCDSDVVDKDLTGITVKAVSEDENFINYVVSYASKEKLKIPAAFFPDDSGCHANITFQAADPSYEQPYKPDGFIKGWAQFTLNDFKDIQRLNNLSLNYYYAWERYNDGMQCSHKNPNLCSKFLHLAPIVAPQGIKVELISSGTPPVFQKP